MISAQKLCKDYCCEERVEAENTEGRARGIRVTAGIGNCRMGSYGCAAPTIGRAGGKEW